MNRVGVHNIQYTLDNKLRANSNVARGKSEQANSTLPLLSIWQALGGGCQRLYLGVRPHSPVAPGAGQRVTEATSGTCTTCIDNSLSIT